MFRSVSRTGVLGAVVPLMLLIGCGGSGSNPDGRRDVRPDVRDVRPDSASGGSGGGTGGAGTGGSGGSGGAVDAPQDAPRDMAATDAPRDMAADVPSTDVRDAAADRTDAPTETGGNDGGVDAAADVPAETAPETAAETAQETAQETAAETTAETAPETAAETASETADTGTSAFVAIAPCNAVGDYTAADTTIAFRAGPNNGYDPPCVTIPKGGSVTFTGTFSTHPLSPRTETGASANNPITLTNTGTTHMVTFPNAGFFPYVCTVHGAMVGVIQVTE